MGSSDWLLSTTQNAQQLFWFARNSYWPIHFQSEWAFLIGCWASSRKIAQHLIWFHAKLLNICSKWRAFFSAQERGKIIHFLQAKSGSSKIMKKLLVFHCHVTKFRDRTQIGCFKGQMFPFKLARSGVQMLKAELINCYFAIVIMRLFISGQFPCFLSKRRIKYK